MGEKTEFSKRKRKTWETALSRDSNPGRRTKSKKRRKRTFKVLNRIRVAFILRENEKLSCYEIFRHKSSTANNIGTQYTKKSKQFYSTDVLEENMLTTYNLSVSTPLKLTASKLKLEDQLQIAINLLISHTEKSLSIHAERIYTGIRERSESAENMQWSFVCKFVHGFSTTRCSKSCGRKTSFRTDIHAE